MTIRNDLTLQGVLGVGGRERRFNIQKQVNILSAEVYQSSSSSASPITGGLIKLNGRLEKLFRSKEKKDRRLTVELRDRDISFSRLLASIPSSIESGSENEHLGWCIFDREAPPADWALWCLEVSTSKRESEESIDLFEEISSPATAHDILILQLSQGTTTFRRIGVGIIHFGARVFQNDRVEINIV